MMSDKPDVVLETGQELRGFVVEDVTPVDEVRSVVYRLYHPGSGARLLHVHSDDPENLFSVSFPTPPPDDTGMPHILEHAVLAGSDKFPVREPFFEMVKMSMATFINAMTGPDCTYYPVASNVRKDLFNLADVYFDAVFHPLLGEDTFLREGRHLAPAASSEPTGDLTINGIVYNEMKGAYSDPESLLYRWVTHSLFPDTVYGRDAGGDPAAIPHLTYEELRRYHETLYHPSNAFFAFYGNIPPGDYLAFLEARLDPFDRRDAASAIGVQPAWDEPRSTARTYPIGDDEPQSEKTYLGVHWYTGESTQAHDVLMQMILGLVLLGNEGAPLKKAIIDSKLGADLAHGGASSVGRMSTFSLDLKGSEPDRMQSFLDLVLTTLDRIAGGMAATRIEAAFQQAAYHYLEVVPMHPLHTMNRVLHSWIYGGDPIEFLRMGSVLRDCRREWQRNPDVFGALIRERLLDNPHRLSCVLKPDRSMQAQTDAHFAREMQHVREGMSDADMAGVAAKAEELARTNMQPNPPEALAALPQLRVADLPGRLTHVPTEVLQVNGVDLLRNDVFANGVSYLVMDFDLRGLPADLWQYLPRYSEAIGRMGAAGHGYEEMAQRMASWTGGVACHPVFATHCAEPDRPLWRMRFVLKALDDNLPRALEVLQDLLFGIDPRDRERLLDVLVQARARCRTDMVHDGSATAAHHAGRGLSQEGHLLELVTGLPQLHLCERLAGKFDDEYVQLAQRIEDVRDFLLARQRLAASFTGSDAALAAVSAALGEWTARMRDEAPAQAATGYEPFAEPPSEGLAGPIQVAHCVRAMPAPHYSHPDETLLTVGSHLVGLDYVMPAIRFKGNAYGAWFRYSPLGSNMSLGSYRDPAIVASLEVFDRVLDYVSGVDWSQADIDRAIIATAKREERPIRPATATSEALARHLNGQTPERRQQRFETLRRATPAEVKRSLLEAIEAGLPRAATCVVANRKALEDANRKLRTPLVIQDILT